ncbi:MAG: M56 family metallopeptidase [Cytophagales bacterium]|nr:M56 family metallopeptidase [Cytophagales bacterium]
MILYVIRFSISLALIYGFYRLILERERTFVFNRFFLLLGLLISLIVPLISLSGPEEFKSLLSTPEQSLDHNLLMWESIAELIYGLITIFFLVRFGIDTAKLLLRARSGKLKMINGIKIILTDKSHPPYSFLNYVFISEDSFQHIESALIDHEMAHVKQRHTYDILLVEFVKAFIWINPIVRLVKNAMRLNHEFLADQSAIKRTLSIENYQKTLLDYLTSDNAPTIASAFNFSLTKKRFKMMTQQPQKTGYLRQLLVIPLLLVIIWSCSDNQGVSGKEMLKYWRFTANMEEVLQTGQVNENDLKEGVILLIETKKQYDELQDIYSRMNNSQKKSVYELPPYLEPIENTTPE